MRPHGRDDGRDGPRLRLQEGSEAGEAPRDSIDHELVFDFTGLRRPELRDLSFVLTARLQNDPDDRVWVRALPSSTWQVLQALGLDHLFWACPRTGESVN